MINGKKFSGNAFYRHGDHCYHHGTIMVAVDKERLFVSNGFYGKASVKGWIPYAPEWRI
ncbi:MAG: lipoyl protein ligase domain-containing protein [[Clostridium] symbiosum]